MSGSGEREGLPTAGDPAAANDGLTAHPEDTSTAPVTGSSRTVPAAAAAARARRIGGRASTGQPNEPVTPPAAAVPDANAETGAADASEGSGAADASELRATPPGAVTLNKSAPAGRPSVGTPDAATGGRRSSLLRWAPAAALTVALIVLAALVAVSTHGSRWDRPSGDATRDQVLGAAKSCVVMTNSYTYDKLNAFEKKGLGCATGSFAAQFKNSVEKILKKQAPAVKQKQSLQVNTAGIIGVSDNDQWDVLIYGQISVTNTSTTTARLDPFGAVAHLKKVGGSWRVSSLCSQSLGGTTDACY